MNFFLKVKLNYQIFIEESQNWKFPIIFCLKYADFILDSSFIENDIEKVTR